MTLISNKTIKKGRGKKKYFPTIEEERKKKENGIISDKIKVFTSPLWTLEYDILNSVNKTRLLLFSSILEALLIKSRSSSNTYIGLSQKDCEKRQEMAERRISKWEEEGKTKEWIACKIYSKYLENGSVSKAITAQRFAVNLNENKDEIVNILKTASEFEYLSDAIYHVTKQTE